MRKLTVMLLLAVAVGGVYANALNNDFVFDDYLVLVNQGVIPRIASAPRLALVPAVVGYRPLRTLSYVLDYRLGGMQPWIFHLSNLVYHWITACLVFLVVFRLVANEKVASCQLPVASLSNCGLRTADSGLRTALFAACLWALHPIQTDAVTYISGRRDILTGLFFFLGLYAFLRFRAQPPQATSLVRRGVWLLLAFLAYALGVLSKEMAVTLPLVMLCVDYGREVKVQGVKFGWRYVRELWGAGVRTIWGHKYLYLPLLVGGGCFSWYAAFVVLPSWHIGWYGGSIITNFLTVARIWVYYLYLLLWPVRLLADYTGAFAVTHSLRDPLAFLAVGFVLVLFLLVLGSLRYSRLAAFAGLWIVVTLLPVSHIIPHPEMMAEHYLYIPSFGFCLLVALSLAHLTQSPRSEKEEQVTSRKAQGASLWKPAVGYGLLVALLTFYAARIVVRNRDWRDNLTFYVRLVADNPYSARARLGLGYVYDHSGLPRMAINHYQVGLKFSPRDPRLLTNMGAAYQKLGELSAAEQAYLASLKMQPHNSKTLNNLGFLYTEKREFDKARSFLEQAEKFSIGRDPAIYANFGLLYEIQGKLSEALEAYRKARELNPDGDVSSQKIEELKKNLEKQDQSTRAPAAGSLASP
ncbi:MAG TPA: tetratricopeptide repeat protein [Candidatus Binatia bacterium]|jgi:Flp pilus assembly protein TadD|nr:tetratricopeptide repeat protein [Candidatus Binatia bacterium]